MDQEPTAMTDVVDVHLEFEVSVSHRNGLTYYYLRCRQHPSIVFMLDPIELENVDRDAIEGEWRNLTHSIARRTKSATALSLDDP